MFGKIELANFEGLKTMPQEAASAWATLDTEGLVGATYKPLLYCGNDQVKGVLHWFIAEETIQNERRTRRIVKLAINSFDGKYTVIPHSFKEIEFGL